MSSELDRILVLPSDPSWHQRIRDLHRSLRQASYFDHDDERYRQLLKILGDVRGEKDAAVSEYTEKFDGVRLSADDFLVPSDNLQKAHQKIDKGLLGSIRKAIDNVRRYQREIFVGQNEHPGLRYLPIERVGVCVPGASAPLPSTVVMTLVPAQVAGVGQIAVFSPPRYNGGIHPVILAVCYELGITEVYRIGGAQAVAALAYGTDTIRPVNKIVGPGNVWVQMAKKELFGIVGIDSIAGPSEVLIIANDQANPAWIAADMLSQAEHAPGSALLFTDSKELAQKTLEELKKQVSELARSQETLDCLLKFSMIIPFKDIDDAILQANFFAPEHLEIQCGAKSREIADHIKNAGAVFIGEYSPVAVGDYWAGPSHTLPTGQTAKFFSALSANDFIKSTSIIEYDKKKLAESAADIIRLAEAEGLDAHARSIRVRQQ